MRPANGPDRQKHRGLLERAVEVLRPQRVTIVVTKKPFAPAVAASRGEKTRDVEAWLETLPALLG